MGMTSDEICLSCDWHMGGILRLAPLLQKSDVIHTNTNDLDASSVQTIWFSWWDSSNCPSSSTHSPCSVQSDIHEPKPWFRRSQSRIPPCFYSKSSSRFLRFYEPNNGCFWRWFSFWIDISYFKFLFKLSTVRHSFWCFFSSYSP